MEVILSPGDEDLVIRVQIDRKEGVLILDFVAAYDHELFRMNLFDLNAGDQLLA